jgi:hypothetical protein
MKLLPVVLFPALLLAACGEAPSGPDSADMRDTPAAEALSSTASGPAISPTAAPGVAFTYAYQFRLPGIRIAKVQEEHAQACEKLGVTKCRITGLRYRVRGKDVIEAMLSFKLAPDIARQFGKDGVATVEKAQGMVVDTEIGGTDVSSAISTAKRNTAETEEQITALEAQLAKGGLKAETQARLTAQIDELRSARRANIESREQNENALANTPMTFTYGSGALIPGFDARSPIVEALQTAGNILLGILCFLIVAVAFLVPVMLLLGLSLYTFRRLRPTWRRWTGYREGTETATP